MMMCLRNAKRRIQIAESDIEAGLDVHAELEVQRQAQQLIVQAMDLFEFAIVDILHDAIRNV